MNVPSIRLPVQRLGHHPMLLSVIVFMIAMTLIGWQFQTVLFDRQLPPDKVSARQLRVSQTLLDTLQRKLTEYRRDQPIPTVGATFAP